MSKRSMKKILELSVAERLRLAQALWESVRREPESLEVTPAERRVLDRRLGAHRRNPAAGASWPVVRKRVARGR